VASLRCVSERGELIWKWLEEQFSLTSEAKRPGDPFAFLHSYRVQKSWLDFNDEIGDALGKLRQRFGSLRSVENWLNAYKAIAPSVRVMLTKGEITSSQARHIAEGLLGRPELQERAARKMAPGRAWQATSTFALALSTARRR